VLYSFTGGADGANPDAGLTFDAAGNLYGTTYAGGTNKSGVVFELNAAGVETVLYTFTGSAGGMPTAGVVMDSAGNLYGTAANVVYRLAPDGQYKVLWKLGCLTGGYADAGVVLDAAGNLYGTTDVSEPGCS